MTFHESINQFSAGLTGKNKTVLNDESLSSLAFKMDAVCDEFSFFLKQKIKEIKSSFSLNPQLT